VKGYHSSFLIFSFFFFSAKMVEAFVSAGIWAGILEGNEEWAG
jgi:hypothetical protein